ncbi:MAG: molybdopterin-guanine dinucleotide biosynthesis protein B [Candidatus Bathyarchaeota archaeon]|nr:molybdopterin-guanine dinucleotide biosynthesis protein B [Candidatus Bathyarchaeota archaeon]
MKPKVVSVVGARKVGKTTTVENLIEQLTMRGYRVSAIKHISKPQWSIDTPGKDSHRFAQKGAKTVVVVSPNETATIQKAPTENIKIQTLIAKAKADSDIILTEGFKKQVAKKTSIPKIAITTNQQQATEALKTYKPLLAFSGPYNTQNITQTVPYIDALKNPKELADLVEEKVLKN